jgi:glyoxylase-like metal-dependent hydrolase (beta-lactamase superfamily II)
MLVALVGASTLSIVVSGYQQQQPAAGRGGQPAAMVVQADKVKDNLYVLKGGGGNTTLFIGTNGVTVVDTKLAGWGAPLLAKIKELTPKPVTMIINTHSHGDHVSGNVEFPASVDIVAQENTKKNVEAWPAVYGLNNNFPNVVKDNGGKGLPKKTFKDKMTIGSGADRIDLFYFGRAHTNGDAWVLFPALRVMASGDAFANKSVPIMDRNAGGSGVEFPDTVTKAYNGVKDVDVIVTGHAQTTMTRDDLKTYGDFMRDFVTAVRDAKKQGKSPDDFAASWKVPEKYAGYPAAQAAGVKNAAQVVMDEIK